MVVNRKVSRPDVVRVRADRFTEDYARLNFCNSSKVYVILKGIQDLDIGRILLT